MRLDGLDASIRASGLDVVDFAVTKQVRPWVDFSFDIDNLTDKRYYETQNYFESRVTRTAPVVNRNHGTPSYPIGFTAGLTFRLQAK
jgi:outer membrane receptor protein involved in Fe transport